jgi:hypothetical protein
VRSRPGTRRRFSTRSPKHVVIQVAVHDAPMRGKDVAEYLFTGLRDDLGELRINDEIIERDRAVVLFETTSRTPAPRA